MARTPDAAAAPGFTVKGRHVLMAVVGFFVVVIGLDSLFVVWAVQSFPGEVSSRAYEDGLAYNQTLKTRRAQAALGWSTKVSQGGAPGRVGVSFTDAAGTPIEGLRVTAKFVRPTTDAGAREAALRAAAPGLYEGGPELAPGAWDLTLTAVDADGRSFEARRRLVWR